MHLIFCFTYFSSRERSDRRDSSDAGDAETLSTFYDQPVSVPNRLALELGLTGATVEPVNEEVCHLQCTQPLPSPVDGSVACYRKKCNKYVVQPMILLDLKKKLWLWSEQLYEVTTLAMSFSDVCIAAQSFFLVDVVALSTGFTLRLRTHLSWPVTCRLPHVSFMKHYHADFVRMTPQNKLIDIALLPLVISSKILRKKLESRFGSFVDAAHTQTFWMTVNEPGAWNVHQVALVAKWQWYPPSRSTAINIEALREVSASFMGWR
jgi:hypothetical protein